MIRNHKVNVSLGPGHGFTSEQVAEIELTRRKMERDINESMTWLDAIRAVDQKRDPAPLLALLNIPPSVAPYVEDLFDRKLGPGLSRRGPKIPLAQKNKTTLAKAASLVQLLTRVDHDLTVSDAVDQVRKQHRDIAKQISRKKLLDHCRNRSGHSRRAKRSLK